MVRRTIGVSVLAAAMLVGNVGGALASHGGPPGSPLPVNGEPSCFGQRVSHSASQHGLTPKAKIAQIEEALAYLGSLPPEARPPWYGDFAAFFADGVTVQRIQRWIRTNCSDEPIIANP